MMNQDHQEHNENSDPELNLSFKTDETGSDSQNNSKLQKRESASDTEPDATGTQFYNTVYRRGALLQDTDENLERDNSDLHQQNPDPITSPPQANQREAIREWLANSPYNQAIMNNDRIPVITRSGRVVKQRKIFDPADEVDREKELKLAY